MIIWVPSGPYHVASSRFYAWRPHEILSKYGCDSIIGRYPARVQHDLTLEEHYCLYKMIHDQSAFHIIVLQKIWGRNAIALASDAHITNSVVLYAASNIRNDAEIAKAATACIASSDLIRHHLAKNCGDVEIAPEPPDCWVHPKQRNFSSSIVQRICWIGSADNQARLNHIFQNEEAMKLNVNIKVISHGGKTSVRYDPNKLKQLTADCDAMLVTSSVNPEASPNRIVLAMALCLPAIVEKCHPYSSMVDHGKNGFVIERACDLLEVLKQLRNPLQRKAVATKGYESVYHRYCDEAICKWWLNYFERHGWLDRLNFDSVPKGSTRKTWLRLKQLWF